MNKPRQNNGMHLRLQSIEIKAQLTNATTTAQSVCHAPCTNLLQVCNSAKSSKQGQKNDPPQPNS
eukprot:6301086-Pyramimonas_sp.AAC.1